MPDLRYPSLYQINTRVWLTGLSLILGNPEEFSWLVPTPDEIAKQFTAYYQPIVDLNTGTVTGFEALARVVQADGLIATAGAVIDEIEGQPDALKALIRTILFSIQRDMVPLFERHQHFYVSVNIPPVILGSGEVLTIVEELKLTPYLNRIACEVTERQ